MSALSSHRIESTDGRQQPSSIARSHGAVQTSPARPTGADRGRAEVLVRGAHPMPAEPADPRPTTAATPAAASFDGSAAPAGHRGVRTRGSGFSTIFLNCTYVTLGG